MGIIHLLLSRDLLASTKKTGNFINTYRSNRAASTQTVEQYSPAADVFVLFLDLILENIAVDIGRILLIFWSVFFFFCHFELNLNILHV
jgi:hypothetical protein